MVIQILVEDETDCSFLKTRLARMPGFLFTLPPTSANVWQKAARFEKRAATRNQLYESTFADKSMWDWESPALGPLKRFLIAFLSLKP